MVRRIASVRVHAADTVACRWQRQVKPMSKGMLLDMGIMNPGQGQTLVRRVKVQSDHMEDALTFMREGRAYVRVAHEHGELRGQLVVPHCLDGDLNGTDQHYGFANIMVSPDPEDKSTAILVQVAFAVSYPRCRFFRMLPVFSALVALAPNLAHRFASVCVCVCVCVCVHTHTHTCIHTNTHTASQVHWMPVCLRTAQLHAS